MKKQLRDSKGRFISNKSNEDFIITGIGDNSFFKGTDIPTKFECEFKYNRDSKGRFSKIKQNQESKMTVEIYEDNVFKILMKWIELINKNNKRK